MEGAYMTDFQYRSIVKSILLIMEGSKDLKEAQDRVRELIEEK